MRWVTIFILLIALCTPAFVHADDSMGPELTFESEHTKAALAKRTNPNPAQLGDTTWQNPTVDGEYVDAIKLRDQLMKNCSGCKLTVLSEKWATLGIKTFLIEFTNGYWIKISVDPGVVELQTPVLSSEAYEKLTDFIESAVYQEAQNVALAPKLGSDGHLNFGAHATFGTAENLAAFLLDQVNHPELALGVLGFDLLNGPPLAVQSRDQLDAFFDVMDRVKSGKIKTIKALAHAVNMEVYYQSMDKKYASGGRHYQAVSLKRLLLPEFITGKADMPVEVRYPQGMPNFKQVLLIYRLFLKRIDFLKSKPRRKFANAQRELYDNVQAMSPAEKLNRFYIFVTEMGENFEQYKSLIFDPRVTGAALDSFADRNAPAKRRAKDAMSYLPDLETSQWAQDRFKEILNDPQIPREVRGELRAAFRARIRRENIPEANLAILVDYQREILPKEQWYDPPPRKARDACSAVRRGWLGWLGWSGGA